MSIFAVIKTGGKQYLVEEGDVLAVEKLDAKPGDRIEFEVLLKSDGEALEIGKPLVNGKVTAEVLAQGRTKKISVVKYKAKSRYTRRVGHRQAFTKVKIAKV